MYNAEEIKNKQDQIKDFYDHLDLKIQVWAESTGLTPEEIKANIFLI